MKKYQCIADDVILGRDVKIFQFVNLYGCIIQDETKIGSFVEIQKGVKIAPRCKISSHTFICEGVTIQEAVFIGHHVTFTNDKFPKSVNNDNCLLNDNEWETIPTIVKKGASIGSNATILCGITIGENSLIGAGSVVTKSIPPNEVWAGNPAIKIRDL